MKQLYMCIAALLIVTACYEEPEPEKPGVFFDAEAFLRHRELWNKQGFANYAVIERVIAYSLGIDAKATVIVKNNTVTDVKIWVKGSGWEAIGEEPDRGTRYLLEHIMTVPEFFSYIEKMYQDARHSIESGRNSRIEIAVSYDDLYHIPVSLSYNTRVVNVTNQPIGNGGWEYYMEGFSPAR